MADPFDNVNDGPTQDDGLVEISRKKSRPRVATRYIPPSHIIGSDEEGRTIITQTPGAVARNVEHLKTLQAPMIHQGAGRKMADKTGVVKCDYSDSPDVHSGPATHFLRLPGVPREGVEAVCEKHLRMAQERASQRGENIFVDRIKPHQVEGFKILRRVQEQEKLAGIQSALLEKGMTGESAQYGPAQYNTTAEPKPLPESMRLYGKSESPTDPNWDPSGPVPRGKRINYDFPKRTTKVAVGKKEPEAYVNPELSDEEISRLDPATRLMLQERRSRGVPAWGLKQYSSKNIGVMPMKFETKGEALPSAFEKIAEEVAPAIQGQVASEAQAIKQRKNEAIRRGAEFRTGIEGQAKPKPALE